MAALIATALVTALATPMGAFAAAVAGTVGSAIDTGSSTTGSGISKTAPTVAADEPTRSAAAKPCTGLSPLGSYAATLSFTVSTISPQLVTRDGPATLTVTGTMTNTGTAPLSEIGYKFQRGDAFDDDAAIRQEAATPCQPIAVINSGFVALAAELAPGDTAEFHTTVPITGDPTDSLAITAPGVYPVMINLNATVGQPSGAIPARVGEIHLLMTVLSVPPALTGGEGSAAPGAGGTPGSGTGPTPTPVTLQPIAFSTVWPVVDRSHLGVNGIFLDDDLTALISPGGRLYNLVTTLSTTENVPGSVTLAIDPELLDELDRMSHGYWVVAPPGSRQPPLTPVPNSTGTTIETAGPTTDNVGPSVSAVSSRSDGPAPTPGGATTSAGATAAAATSGTSALGAGTVTASAGKQPSGTVAGTGSAAALSFLQQLRQLARSTAVLVLPYSDPDSVALVRAGMTSRLAGSVYLGRAVASRVLGIEPTAGTTSSLITDIAFPVDGYADVATLRALKGLQQNTAILTSDSVTEATAGASVLTVPVGTSTTAVTALVPNRPLLGDIEPFLTAGVPANAATSINLVAALIAGLYFAGTGQPLLLVGDRSADPDHQGAAAIASLLTTMGQEGVITGADLRTLAATPGGTASIDYPASAKRQELSPAYLARVRDTAGAITSLRISLNAVDGPGGGDPADLLDPLQAALAPVTAASVRDNPAPAARVLDTVNSSLRGIEARVTVPRSSGSITLASSSAPLRLTVQNTLPYDVRVRIAITGGQRVGLTTTDPGIQLVPAGRSVPVKVPAHVARSGTFTISAQLMTVDGRKWGSPVALQVNSRAYGTLTLVLMIVAGSVLVIMVIIRIVQRARGHTDRNGPTGGSAGGSGRDGSTTDQTGSTPLTEPPTADPPVEAETVPTPGRTT
jgi:hypothetical protein